jgi:hypothetical protein
MNLLISIGVSVGSNPTLSATSFANRFRDLSHPGVSLLANYCQILGTLGDESRSA